MVKSIHAHNMLTTKVLCGNKQHTVANTLKLLIFVQAGGWAPGLSYKMSRCSAPGRKISITDRFAHLLKMGASLLNDGMVPENDYTDSNLVETTMADLGIFDAFLSRLCTGTISRGFNFFPIFLEDMKAGITLNCSSTTANLKTFHKQVKNYVKYGICRSAVWVRFISR